jgi:hypothetical protein
VRHEAVFSERQSVVPLHFAPAGCVMAAADQITCQLGWMVLTASQFRTLK